MKPCSECGETERHLSSCQTGAESYELRMRDAGDLRYTLAESIDEDTLLGYQFNPNSPTKVK